MTRILSDRELEEQRLKMAQQRDYAVARYISENPDDEIVQEYRVYVSKLNEKRGQFRKITEASVRERRDWEKQIKQMQRTLEHKFNKSISENKQKQKMLMKQVESVYNSEIRSIDSKCNQLRRLLLQMAKCGRQVALGY